RTRPGMGRPAAEPGQPDHRRAALFSAAGRQAMTCFSWLILLAGAIFVIVSLIRWFEQVTEAVQNRWWSKTALLVLFPFSTWFFSSRISAGRPTPVPHHEPVRGFGSIPKARPTETPAQTAAPEDLPPPGTPPE